MTVFGLQFLDYSFSDYSFSITAYELQLCCNLEVSVGQTTASTIKDIVVWKFLWGKLKRLYNVVVTATVNRHEVVTATR